MDSTRSNFVKKVVNDPNTGSKLVVVEPSGSNPPLANGTLSDVIGSNALSLPANAAVQVKIAGKTEDVELSATLMPGAELGTIAALLEAAIRTARPANPAFAGATVTVAGQRLHVRAGAGNPAERVVFDKATTDANTVSLLKLLPAPPATFNAQEYTLGTVAAVTDTAQIGGTLGGDGIAPDSAALIGSLNNKTGLYALEDVDLFNLLCLPGVSVMADQNKAQAVLTAAELYCEKRRAFLLIDTPAGRDEPQEIKNWLTTNAVLRHKNAALFYPRVRIPDPLDDFRLRTVGASGTLAGLFARTDVARGVWKAPAGTEATLRNVTELDDLLTNQENGTLNPLAINCLRSFPVYGNVSWGARTLDGADQQASEWKYIPVRRLALFLEESLYRGTQWVVFEPNDEPLWSQIRINLGAFMHNLFRQGAFQGRSPREAYLVKCDRETTTQNDIDNGIVNIVVGFAPLKPAEFVILKIQQLAGQIQT
jgi:phage tail sheath protein FI